MAVSTEAKIWLALKSRIQTIPEIPGSPNIPIAWPGITFLPTAAPFIAVGMTVAAPRRVLISKGDNDRSGTLILSFCRKIGQDLAVYQEGAGIIAAHFIEETKMKYLDVCLKVTVAPQVQEGFADDGWWRTPVNIRWRTSK